MGVCILGMCGFNKKHKKHTITNNWHTNQFFCYLQLTNRLYALQQNSDSLQASEEVVEWVPHQQENTEKYP